jgi:Tfp pilus assembly PilM family ATPase
LHWLLARRAPIGLQVSGRWIKAIQFRPAKRPGQPPAIVACARLAKQAAGHEPAESGAPAPAPAHLTAADAATLAGVLERQGFIGRRVVLVAPRDTLLTEVLELPPRASGAPIEQLARIELARVSRCEPDSFELGTWDLPTSSGSGPQPVFAVGMPHARSEPLVATLDAAGLEVVAIDTPGCSLARACGPLLARPAVSAASGGLLNAVLDVGWNTTLLVAVFCGPASAGRGVVVYERSIMESGLRRVFESLQSRLGLDPGAVEVLLDTDDPASQDAADPRSALRREARVCVGEYLEAIAPEVQRSLAYLAHRYQGWAPGRLLLTGDGAELGIGEDIQARVAAAVSMPVVRAAATDIARPRTPSAARPGFMASHMAAAGASLHGLEHAAAAPVEPVETVTARRAAA